MRRSMRAPGPVAAFLSQKWGEFFVGLGVTDDIPKCLQLSGKAYNNRLEKAEAERMVEQIWDGKDAHQATTGQVRGRVWCGGMRYRVGWQGGSWPRRGRCGTLPASWALYLTTVLRTPSTYMGRVPYYCTPPSSSLPCPALQVLSLADYTIIIPALPCPALLCPALQVLSLADYTTIIPALPCPALPCPALPCPALPCRCLAWRTTCTSGCSGPTPRLSCSWTWPTACCLR